MVLLPDNRVVPVQDPRSGQAGSYIRPTSAIAWSTLSPSVWTGTTPGGPKLTLGQTGPERLLIRSEGSSRVQGD